MGIPLAGMFLPALKAVGAAKLPLLLRTAGGGAAGGYIICGGGGDPPPIMMVYLSILF